MSLEKRVSQIEEDKKLFEKMQNYVANNKELLDELHHGMLLAVGMNEKTGDIVIVDNGKANYLARRIKDIGNRHSNYKYFIITDGKTHEGLVKT